MCGGCCCCLVLLLQLLVKQAMVIERIFSVQVLVRFDSNQADTSQHHTTLVCLLLL
jgi:hypothetical protein